MVVVEEVNQGFEQVGESVLCPIAGYVGCVESSWPLPVVLILERVKSDLCLCEDFRECFEDIFEGSFDDDLAETLEGDLDESFENDFDE
jgi:hypothetical protein